MGISDGVLPNRTLDTKHSLSLYVHVPFCRARCAYCAFNTYTDLDHLIAPYVDAVAHEIGLVADAAGTPLPAAHTLYFGGGTPSLLEPRHVAAIVEACTSAYNLLSDAEITLEANPESVHASRLRDYRHAGVNRISIGVQSSDANVLRLFNRLHTFDDALRAYDSARAAGFPTVSVDLIYGVPDQSLESWLATLDAVLTWQPDHVSVYSLSLEPGTPLTASVRRGDRSEPDPDLAADMFDHARDRLAHHGYIHYEISNWAQPGHECLHNRQYWEANPYLGFGAGAHGALPDVRYWNVRGIPAYIQRIHSSRKNNFPFSPAKYGHETITRRKAMEEMLILGLRLIRDGVSAAEFLARFGVPIAAVFGKQIDPLLENHLLAWEGDVLRLTGRACLISNQVFIRLIDSD